MAYNYGSSAYAFSSYGSYGYAGSGSTSYGYTAYGAFVGGGAAYGNYMSLSGQAAPTDTNNSSSTGTTSPAYTVPTYSA